MSVLFSNPVTTAAEVAAIITLLFAVFLIKQVLAKGEGNEEMVRISLAIREGAMAYLHRQSKAVISTPSLPHTMAKVNALPVKASHA